MGLKSRYQQRCISSRGSREESIALQFPAFRGHLDFVANGPFFHLQNEQCSISKSFTWTFSSAYNDSFPLQARWLAILIPLAKVIPLVLDPNLFTGARDWDVPIFEGISFCLSQSGTRHYGLKFTDTGKITGGEPIKFQTDLTKQLCKLPQYPRKPEAKEGLKSTDRSLITSKGLFISYTSLCNKPNKKPNKRRYWFAQDPRAINKIMMPCFPVVSNPNTMLSSIPNEPTCCTGVDSDLPSTLCL